LGVAEDYFGATLVWHDFSLQGYQTSGEGIQISELLAVASKDNARERAVSIIFTKVEKSVSRAGGIYPEDPSGNAPVLAQAGGRVPKFRTSLRLRTAGKIVGAELCP
jgi:hypothetical protein